MPLALTSKGPLVAQEDKDEADQDEQWDGNQVKIQVSFSLEGSKHWMTLTGLYRRPRGYGWGTGSRLEGKRVQLLLPHSGMDLGSTLNLQVILISWSLLFSYLQKWA